MIEIKTREQRAVELLKNSALSADKIEEIVERLNRLNESSALVTETASEIRRALIVQRNKVAEAAKVPTAASRIQQWLRVLQVHAYGAIELDHLLATLGVDEAIMSVGWHAITTSARSITREFLRSDNFMPQGRSNQVSWQKQFTPLAEIRRLEADAAALENPNPVRNINLDFGPSGIRR